MSAKNPNICTDNSKIHQLFRNWPPYLSATQTEIEDYIVKCKTADLKADLVNDLMKMYPVCLPSNQLGKNNDVADLARDEGNKHFWAKNFERALESYSKSVAYAKRNSTNLALALSSRAGCLLMLEYFSAGLTDARRALKIPNMGTFTNHIKFRRDYCKLNLSRSNYDPPLPPLPEIKTKGNYFENASSKIQLKWKKRLGRYLKATGEINGGEVLLIEKPFAAMLHPNAYYSHCFYCFRRSHSLKECSKCACAMYCSKKCLNDDEEVHQFLCPILGHLLYLEVGECQALSIRVLIDACLDDTPLRELAKEEPKDDRYLSSDIRRVIKLAHFPREPLVEMRVGFATAIFVQLLRQFTQFFDIFPVTEIEARAFLFKIICTLMPNTNQIGTEETGAFGFGVYPAIGMMNHSCVPNTARHFVGKYQIIRAMRSIRKGEEIFDDYSCNYFKIGWHGRQMVLNNIYGFKCMCEACRGDWPAFDQMINECPREFLMPGAEFPKLEMRLQEIHQREPGHLTTDDLLFLFEFLDYLDYFKVRKPFKSYTLCQTMIYKILQFFPDYNR